MGKCANCGKGAGLGNSKCYSCTQLEIEARKKLSEKESAEAEDARQARIEKDLGAWLAGTKLRLKSDLPVYHYESIYLSVDSTVEGEELGEFSLRYLQAAGLVGWRIVGVIPRTHGQGLVNKETQGFASSKVWGGGMGGNIAGVYLILEKELRDLESDSGQDAIDLARELLNDEVEL
jgi:hypothetical protein